MLRSIAALQTGNWDHADQGIRFDKTGYLAEVSREIEGVRGLDSPRPKGVSLGTMKPDFRLLYKRNQVVEAIALLLQHGSTRLDPELRSRVKRLLEIDRGRGRNRRSRDPEEAHFAFYSADVPGRGHENFFTAFETFALLTGLRLLAHGWPQGTVVGLLRRLRPELEMHHARILRQPLSILSDEQQQVAARPGDPVVANLDPLFVVIISEQGRRRSRSVALCRGQREVFELYHKFGPGYAFTLTEVATSIHELSSALANTQPRPRGRSRA